MNPNRYVPPWKLRALTRRRPLRLEAIAPATHSFRCPSFLIAACLASLGLLQTSLAAPLRPADWDQLSVPQKADWLVSQMTFEEKVEQLNVGPEVSKRPKGLGRRSQIPNERLGIFPIKAGDGPRGPRPDGDRPANRTSSGQAGPVAPTGLALASTWNPELQAEMGRQWGLLSKEYGINALYGPGINIIKDPRAGRNTDYAAEDPFLNGSYGVAVTKGLQSTGIAAVAKHLVANNWESGRQSHNVEVPMRPLREIYLAGFQMTVQEGGVIGLMTCYNALNGRWGSADKWLLTDVVRDEWGFEGFFVSDWGAEFGSAGQAIKAGQNLELPGQRIWNQAAIQTALDRGEITMADIDARVAELLRVKLGMITYEADGAPSGYDLEAFKAVSRKAGGESLVLLKNSPPLLPLKPEQSIALIGPFADDVEYMIGNAGSSTVQPSYAVTLKEALGSRGVKVNFERGGGDAFAYEGGAFKPAFPCRIDFFNGQNLEGPVVYSKNAPALVLGKMQAGSPGATIAQGFKGRALRSSGNAKIEVASTPKSPAWTLGLMLRLDDQLPPPDKNILVLWNGRQRLVMTADRLSLNNGKVTKSADIDWQDMDNQWRQVFIVSDGTNLRCYRDGQKIAEIKNVGPLKPLQVLIGDDKQGVSMAVDEVSTWSAALTPEQAGTTPADTVESFENFEVANDATWIPGLRDTMDLSLRATAKFVPSRPGKVGFHIGTNGGVRIKIDGKLVYDLFDEQKAEGQKNYFWHTFADTQPHEIVVEFASKHKKLPGFLRLDCLQPPATDIFAGAVAAAKTSDVAIVCVGVPAKQQAENIDRPRIELPAWQDELIAAVAAANPKTVVVLFTEGAVDVRPWFDAVPSVLVAFHPGSEGGNIISDVLYGDVNPSGKLTLTWPKSNDDLPTTGPDPRYPDTVNEFGYRYFDAKGLEPQFPFGFGLSYTTFAQDGLKVRKTDDPKFPVIATVTVKNTGAVAGREVVQIYVSDMESSVEQPLKELAAFAKVDLQPGESRTIDIPLFWMAFQYYDVENDSWVLEPGKFQILAGSSAAALPQESTIEL